MTAAALTELGIGCEMPMEAVLHGGILHVAVILFHVLYFSVPFPRTTYCKHEHDGACLKIVTWWTCAHNLCHYASPLHGQLHTLPFMHTTHAIT